MEKYTDEELKAAGGIIDTRKIQNPIRDIQQVVAVGDLAAQRGIEVGDYVKFNPKRYSKPVHNPGSLQGTTRKDDVVIDYNIPTIEIDGIEYLFVSDNDLEFIVTNWSD